MRDEHELTVGEVAGLLGTSRDTVRRMVDDHVLIARITPGGHRLIPRAAAEAKKHQLDHPGDPLGLGLTPAADRPAAGSVERRERRTEAAGGDSDGGDLLTPDEARAEGRRHGLRLIQQYGDPRWHLEQHRAEIRDRRAHPEKYWARDGDLAALDQIDPSSIVPWPPWPPLVQDEVTRRVAARIERVVFHGIARRQVRRAVEDTVEDCWKRFLCPLCGEEKRLTCDAGCDCEVCEGT